MIVYAWVNDDDTKRAYKGSDDAYRVFRKMLESGHPPDDLSKMLELPYNDDYFSVPPHAPQGHNPQLGTLHPSMVRIAAAAFASIRK